MQQPGDPTAWKDTTRECPDAVIALIVGFAGVGAAWTDLDRFQNQQTAVAGGGVCGTWWPVDTGSTWDST